MNCLHTINLHGSVKFVAKLCDYLCQWPCISRLRTIHDTLSSRGRKRLLHVNSSGTIACVPSVNERFRRGNQIAAVFTLSVVFPSVFPFDDVNDPLGRGIVVDLGALELVAVDYRFVVFVEVPDLGISHALDTKLFSRCVQNEVNRGLGVIDGINTVVVVHVEFHHAIFPLTQKLPFRAIVFHELNLKGSRVDIGQSQGRYIRHIEVAARTRLRLRYSRSFLWCVCASFWLTIYTPSRCAMNKTAFVPYDTPDTPEAPRGRPTTTCLFIFCLMKHGAHQLYVTRHTILIGKKYYALVGYKPALHIYFWKIIKKLFLLLFYFLLHNVLNNESNQHSFWK